MTDQHDLPMEEYHRALREMVRGNPEVYKELFSRRDDVTLANPFGPRFADGMRSQRGWTSQPPISATVRGASSRTSRWSSPPSSRTPSRSRGPARG